MEQLEICVRLEAIAQQVQLYQFLALQEPSILPLARHPNRTAKVALQVTTVCRRVSLQSRGNALPASIAQVVIVLLSRLYVQLVITVQRNLLTN